MESELPKGWSAQRLDELAENSEYPIGDGDHGQIKPSMYQSDGIPYIRVSDMGWGTLDLSKVVYISNEVHKQNLKSKLKPGDVLIAKTGATIGKCCIVPDDVTEANTTSSVGKISLNHELYLPKLLLYYFLTLEFKEFMWSISERTAQPGFNNRDIKLFSIPVPPPNEQKRIVAKLDKLMEKIDRSRARLERIPKILKRFRQSILSAAVTGKLTEEWRGKNGIVEEWQLHRLSDLVDVIGGYAYKSGTFLEKGNNQVLRIGNIKPYEINFDYSPVYVDNELAEDTDKFRVQENDILLSMTGTKYKRDYGYACIARKDSKNSFINQRVSIVRVKKDMDPNYLLHWLQTDAFKNQFFSGETGNVNQGNVGMSGIKDSVIELPSQPEQFEIAATINRLFELANKIEARYNKAKAQLDRLPQALLAKAFRGELVPQDENDEPASVLLERIKRDRGTYKKIKKYTIEEEHFNLAAEP
ncbi:MAG: restriction endonuclease subunit S [Bacteroidetes bacterium]|nr:restriction endonuclease subunit S [Bacteroidota bacterium]